MRPEANREACEQMRANFKSRLCALKVDSVTSLIANDPVAINL
jgi:hypothetical protein